MDERLSFLRSGPPPSALPISCAFEHLADDASGKAAMQYWPPQRGHDRVPEQLTLFILGNPGLLGYYIPFLNHLHSLLPTSHALLSTSHIGHSPDQPFPLKPLDLLAHLNAKIELVRSLRTYLDAWADEADATRPKLALMGHSVGSWLFTEVMKRMGQEEVHAGYMLFPTVGWIAESWNGRTMWPLFRRPFRSLVPTISPLLGPALPFTSFPPTTISLLRSPETIRHALGMAKSEMETIREPDLEWFRSMVRDQGEGQGLFGVWSAGNMDGWAGREGPMVRVCLGGEEGGRVAVLQGVPHAFCLTQQHSEMVADTVASWIVPRPAAQMGEQSGEAPVPAVSSIPM